MDKETLNMYAVGDERGWKETGSRLRPYVVVSADWWIEMNAFMIRLWQMAETNPELHQELIDRDLSREHNRFFESLYLPKNRFIRILWRIWQIFKY